MSMVREALDASRRQRRENRKKHRGPRVVEDLPVALRPHARVLVSRAKAEARFEALAAARASSAGMGGDSMPAPPAWALATQGAAVLATKDRKLGLWSPQQEKSWWEWGQEYARRKRQRARAQAIEGGGVVGAVRDSRTEVGSAMTPLSRRGGGIALRHGRGGSSGSGTITRFHAATGARQEGVEDEWGGNQMDGGAMVRRSSTGRRDSLGLPPTPAHPRLPADATTPALSVPGTGTITPWGRASSATGGAGRTQRGQGAAWGELASDDGAGGSGGGDGTPLASPGTHAGWGQEFDRDRVKSWRGHVASPTHTGSRAGLSGPVTGYARARDEREEEDEEATEAGLAHRLQHVVGAVEAAEEEAERKRARARGIGFGEMGGDGGPSDAMVRFRRGHREEQADSPGGGSPGLPRRAPASATGTDVLAWDRVPSSGRTVLAGVHSGLAGRGNDGGAGSGPGWDPRVELARARGELVDGTREEHLRRNSDRGLMSGGGQDGGTDGRIKQATGGADDD